MTTIIGVEQVEVFRATDARATILVGTGQVARDDEASTDSRPVYTVAGQSTALAAAGGGFTATHDCATCRQTGACWRVLAAADAEGTRRYIQAADATYRERKREMGR